MKKYLVVLTLAMMLLYVAAKVLLMGKYAEYNFALMPLIPGYFILLGSVTISLLKQSTGNGVNLILGLKVAKLLISLLVVFAYVLIVKANAVAFVIVFTAFFLAYLLFETYMLLDWNKKNKKQ